MKLVAIGLISLFLAYGAFASESIYYALDTQEIPLAASRTELRYQKSVGGITCLKVDSVTSGRVYSCEIDIKNFHSKEIYNALSIEPMAMPSNRMELKYKKSVGGLVCLKTIKVSKEELCDCSLKFR